MLDVLPKVFWTILGRLLLLFNLATLGQLNNYNMSKPEQKNKTLNKVSTGQYTMKSSQQMKKQGSRKSDNATGKTSPKYDDASKFHSTQSIDMSQFDDPIDKLEFQPILSQQYQTKGQHSNDSAKNSLCYINDILNKQSVSVPSVVNWQKEKGSKSGNLANRQNEQLKAKIERYEQKIKQLQLVIRNLTIELEKNQKKKKSQKAHQNIIHGLQEQISDKQEQIKKLKSENSNLKVDLATCKKESKQKDKQIMKLLDKIHQVQRQLRQQKSKTPIKKNPDYNPQKKVSALPKQSTTKFGNQIPTRQDKPALNTPKLEQKRSFLLVDDMAQDTRSRGYSRSSSKIIQSKSDQIKLSQYIIRPKAAKDQKPQDKKYFARSGRQQAEPSYKRSYYNQLGNRQQSPVRKSKHFDAEKYLGTYHIQTQNKKLSSSKLLDREKAVRTPNKLLEVQSENPIDSSHASAKRSTYSQKMNGFEYKRSPADKQKQMRKSPKIQSKLGALEAQMQKEINTIRKSRR